ncbi:hypothetical protein D3C81_1892610 [compost metagenome]
MLGLAGRQAELAADQAGRLAMHLEAVAIQVVALGVDEAQLHPPLFRLDQAELEGFGHRQEVAAVVQRGAAEDRGRTAVEQAGAGGQGEQQHKQEEQAMHCSLSFGEAGMIAERGARSDCGRLACFSADGRRGRAFHAL